jgi:hypothetical protein
LYPCSFTENGADKKNFWLDTLLDEIEDESDNVFYMYRLPLRHNITKPKNPSVLRRSAKD